VRRWCFAAHPRRRGDRIEMLFAAVHWSLMALSVISRHRNNLSAFGQERTLFGSGADQHSDASVALKEVPGIARLAKNHHF